MTTQTIPPCPVCNGPISELDDGWLCTNCEFGIPRMIRQKVLDRCDIVGIIINGRSRLIPGFQMPGTTQTFDGVIVLEKNSVRLLPGESTNMKCPKCGEEIYRFTRGFRCGRIAECGFVVYDQFAGLTLSEEQMRDIIVKGNSGLIDGFISKKNGSQFSAMIVVDDGKTEKDPKKWYMGGGCLKLEYPEDKKTSTI